MQPLKLCSNNTQEKLKARQACNLCSAVQASTQKKLEARQALKQAGPQAVQLSTCQHPGGA